MNKRALFSAVLIIVTGSAAKNVFATQQLKNATGANSCDVCHTTKYSGSKENLKSNARAAWNDGTLQAFVDANNTPAPVANTAKPILNQIDTSYDVEVGQPLETIVLAVKDADENPVDLTVKPIPVGAAITDDVNSTSSLQKFDFNWTPTLGQENKAYKLKFTAKENDTRQKYSSNSVKTTIRVWPAGNRDQTSIKNFKLSSAKWTNGKLSLKGTIQFNKLLTKEEKIAYMLNAPTMSFALNQGIPVELGGQGLGAEIVNLPTMIATPSGGWSIADIDLPAQPAFDCSVTMDFEGAKAARKISGAPKDCIATP